MGPKNFGEVLAKQLAEVQRRVSAEHTLALQRLEADNLVLRSENESLRAQLVVPPPSPKSARQPPPSPSVAAPELFAPLNTVPDADRSDESTALPGSWRLSAEVQRPSSPLPLGFAKDDADSPASAWPIWQRINEECRDLPRQRSSGDRLKKGPTRLKHNASIVSSSFVVLASSSSEPNKCVLHPNSLIVLAWTAIGILLLIYDAILIPMTSGFSLAEHASALRTMDAIIITYWAIDLIRGFFTGFENGTLEGVEMRRWEIVKNYSKTWLLIDLVILAGDVVLQTQDAELFLMSEGGPTRAGKATRVWRVVRVVRILRVLKMARRLWWKTENTIYVRLILLVKAFYVVCTDIFVCHYMACYWVGLAASMSDDGTSWLSVHQLEHADVGAVYAVALNWALAQSGFSTSNVQAYTRWEHLYASLCGFTWMVVVCVSIGFFYTWMVEARQSVASRVQEGADLRKYLEQRDVSRGLAIKVLRYFRFNYAPHERRILEAEVKFLRVLPMDFQIRLRRAAYLGLLRTHPFFSTLGTDDEAALIAVCQVAMMESRYAMDETVFSCDVEATRVFMVLSGELDYHPVTGTAVRVQAGEWLCEAALWRRWRHRGRLIASTPCEVMGVDVQKVHAVLEECLGESGWAGIPMVRKHARKALAYYGASGSDQGLRLDTDNLMRTSSKASSFLSPTASRKSGMRFSSSWGAGGSSMNLGALMTDWQDNSTPALVRRALTEIRSGTGTF